LDLPPVQAGLRECGARGDHTVFGEVSAPFAPGVHSGAEYVQGFGRTHHLRRSPPQAGGAPTSSLRSASSPARATLHACTMRSTPSSSVNSGMVVSSISLPT